MKTVKLKINGLAGGGARGTHDPERGEAGAGEDPEPVLPPGPAGVGRLRHLRGQGEGLAEAGARLHHAGRRRAGDHHPRSGDRTSIRRTVIELILSTHPNDCLQCPRNHNCELQTLAAEFGIREVPFGKRAARPARGRLDALDHAQSGEVHPVRPLRGRLPADAERVGAGIPRARREHAHRAGGDVHAGRSRLHQVRPVLGALPGGRDLRATRPRKVWRALADPTKHCVVQIAPAVRVALGEDFGYEPGTLLTGKIYAALRRLGFDGGLRHELRRRPHDHGGGHANSSSASCTARATCR